jgi:hypothetical protein
MADKYQAIIEKLQAARTTGDMKEYKKQRRRLEKWQREYGAYAPVK